MDHRQHSDTEPSAKATGALERKERPVAAALVWVLPRRHHAWARERQHHMQRGKHE